MANINLAPGSQYAGLAKKRRIRIYLLSFVIVIIALAVWGALWFVENDVDSQNKEITDEINKVNMDIAELGSEGERVLLFENRLAALDYLLSIHISWDPFLSDLERLLPHPTVITSITAVAEDQSITVRGTTPNIDGVAQTLASLNRGEERDSIFSGGEFSNINSIETTVNRGDGVEEEVTYSEFNATFQFDNSRLLINQ